MSELRKREVEDEFFICAQCGYCSPVCPIYEEMGWESTSPRGKIYSLKQLLQPGMLGPKIDYMISMDPMLVNRLFQCTLCGHCSEVCMTKIDLPELWKTVRSEIYRLGLWPTALKDLSVSINQQKNIYNMPNEERNIWAMGLEEELLSRVGKNAKVAYFVGCVSSFMGQLAGIPESMAEIMESVGVDFTILGPEEWCCGSPLFVGGGSSLARDLVMHNVERIRELGVETLVTTCAGCYRVWKHDYPEIIKDFEFEVLHASEFLANLIDEGKLKLGTSAKSILTYHDPCELGRLCGIYEAPRKIIESIQGAKFVELSRIKENSRCCGGGGLLKATNPELSNKIASRKVDEAQETGATTITSGCAACKLAINGVIMEKKSALEMLDITELVRRFLT